MRESFVGAPGTVHGTPPHICDEYYQPGFTAWGSFAERVAIPHAHMNLVRLPDEMGFVESASLGATVIDRF